MLMYRDYVTFTILGQEINLMSCDTDYGQNTVAEIGDRYHYLGKEIPNIAAAIFAWQEVNGRDLTGEEIRQTLNENDFSSQI